MITSSNCLASVIWSLASIVKLVFAVVSAPFGASVVAVSSALRTSSRVRPREASRLQLVHLGLLLIDILLCFEALERQRLGTREVLFGGNQHGRILGAFGLCLIECRLERARV